MDSYLDPETSVLRNIPDIRDPDIFNQVEADTAAWRIRQLEHRPLAGGFDASHLQAIHRHIFQDIFDWAGSFRTVDISRGDQMFCVSHFIPQSIDTLFAQLASENFGRKLGAAQFAARAAHYLNELNAIHPFREGNGRTQREFIGELALRAGFRISWAHIAKEEMYEASRIGFIGGGSGALRELIERAMNL